MEWNANVDGSVTVPMVIPVTSGVGAAPTKIAAFDAALIAAGVGDVNLIPLSSVIPAGAVIEAGEGAAPAGEWGDRLFVVMAEQREDRPGVTAAAGLGWVQDPADGAGLFVEIAGESEDEVRWTIERSLESMVSSRPHRSFGLPRWVIRSVVCQNAPVCAVVVASFEAKGWSIGTPEAN